MTSISRVPSPSPFPFADAVRRRLDRHFGSMANFWCHLGEGVFTSIGLELRNPGVLFPILAGVLGASPSEVGILTSLSSLSFLVPLLWAHRIEASRRKKMLALWFAVAYYAPFLLIAVAILLFAASAPLSCLWITAFLMLVSQAFMSLHGSPWFDLVAETIPRHEIGRLLGYRNAVSAFAGIFAGAVCSAALKSFHFPANFAFVYALAVAVFVLASYSFSMVDEIPAYAVPKERTRPGQYLRGLFSVLRTDGNYRSYLSYGFLGRLASAAGPFYALAATQRLGGDPALAAGGFVVAASLAKIGGNIGLPYFTRRFGNKRMMAVGVIAGALGACIAAFAPSWHWYFATFSLFGVSMAAAAVSGTPFVMSVFPRSRRVGYLALQNLLLGAPMLVLGPAAGVFLERFGHPALFALAAGATLLSLLPLSRCRARAPESGENSVKE